MPTRRRAEPDRDIGPLFSFDDGGIDQAIAADFLRIPWRLELKDGRLLYSYMSPRVIGEVHLGTVPLPEQRDQGKAHALGIPLLKAPSPRLLDGFMRLGDEPDEEVLAYARRWGVLDLCEHGLPYTHNVGAMRWGTPRRAICSPLRYGKSRYSRSYNYGLESIEAWRRWARTARGLMRIAAALKAGRPGSPEDWNAALQGKRPYQNSRKTFRLLPHGETVQWDWRLLCMYVNDWCDLVQVSPHLASRVEGTVVLRFGSGSRRGTLFGILGLQMMTRISGVGSMAICSSCGDLYKPTRAPDPSRLNFCLDCGREESVRMAKKRMTDRKKAARTMSREGHSPSEIATKLGTRPATVRRWLPKRGDQPE